MKKFLDTSHPLLERFKSVAPGTFQHSLNVMNLCESLAKTLKLDADMLKVSAMYHDIGKMWNPGYYSENITDENPHDKLDPLMSYQILTRHVSDGVAILIQEPEMPREVIEIITKHHGDAILQAMWNKVKDTGVGEHVYRYKGPKPNCPYSSILMITDSIEAKARSLHAVGKLETHDDKKDCVLSTIEMLREDEQLDEMKVGTLRKVSEKLIRELDSIYHTRVSYEPEEEVEK